MYFTLSDILFLFLNISFGDKIKTKDAPTRALIMLTVKRLFSIRPNRAKVVKSNIQPTPLNPRNRYISLNISLLVSFQS